MSFSLRILRLYAAFLFFGLSIVAYGQEHGLKLSIDLSKNRFLLSEPIWLDATLTNDSQKPVRIYGFFPPCQGPFTVELKDSAGNIIPYTGPQYDMTPNPGLILDPGEYYYGCFNLLELFNKGRGLLHHIWGELPIGHYFLKATYQDLPSAQCEFDIIAPSGNEVAPYQLLQDAFAARRKRQPDVHNRKLREIVDTFPNSVYAEKALRELFEDETLLNRFPNSGYTERCIMSLTRELDSSSKKAFLEEVKRTEANSRSAKFAEQMLKWPTN